jgi:hypothetical protein
MASIGHVAIGMAAARAYHEGRLPRWSSLALWSALSLTDGGLGCALFWPFDLTRYFAPWRPIPVAPIGLAFLSPYGVRVAAAELADLDQERR